MSSSANKRIFISFAMEDKFVRDNLVFQAKRQQNVPFEFDDFSVKTPWSSAWKSRCRTKIRGCDGVIAFISENTPTASGARWEIACAIADGVPLLALWAHWDDKRGRPPELGSRRILEWTWNNVSNFLDRL